MVAVYEEFIKRVNNFIHNRNSHSQIASRNMYFIMETRMKDTIMNRFAIDAVTDKLKRIYEIVLMIMLSTSAVNLKKISRGRID